MPSIRRTRIECCNGCVAPKRHPDCHGSCPEYAKERAELDESKRIINQRTYTAAGVQEQKYDRITKAVKRRRS